MSLRILIVEDEAAIALLISRLIDVERLDAEVCGTAHNGRKALEMIRDLQPDIVVTDISMPGMTGIEMIEEAKTQGLKSRYIIISGLTQFSYAVSAIELGVEGYLLKPINKNELNNLLEKTAMKIADSSRTARQMKFLKKTTRIQLKNRRRDLLMKLLYQNAADAPESDSLYNLERINREYYFKFQNENPYLIGIVRLDADQPLNYLTLTGIIDSQMQQFDTEMKKHTIECEEYNYGNGFLFLLNYEDRLPQVPYGILTMLQEILAESFSGTPDMTVTIACGTPCETLSGLPMALESALATLKARTLLGCGKLLKASEVLSMNPCSYHLSDSVLEKLRSQAELGNLEEMKESLRRIFRDAAEGCRPCPHRLQDVFVDIYSEIVSCFRRLNLIEQNLRHLVMTYQEAVSGQVRLEALIQFTTDQILSLFPEEDDDSIREERIAIQAKSFIQAHLDEDLHLEDVASQFYFSPSYFGVLFKEKTGQSFSSYLTTVRIARAKELLNDAGYTIDMVASASGFNDRRYFTKIFKKEVGITPKEYRKIYLP